MWAEDLQTTSLFQGDDPVGFAEEFLRNYADGQWIRKERAQLVAAVDAAVAAQEQS